MSNGPNAKRMLAFFDKWETDFDTMAESFREIFAENAVWWNTPKLPQVRGFQEAYEQVLKPSKDSALAMECIRVDTLNITEADNKVYHERIDHLLRTDGSVIISIPISGITEFDDNGKIIHWRDYCDPGDLLALMAGS
jgi:limonene-1,2-epoxide hydrolase